MNTKIVAKTMKVESNRNVSNYVFQFKIFFFRFVAFEIFEIGTKNLFPKSMFLFTIITSFHMEVGTGKLTPI